MSENTQLSLRKVLRDHVKRIRILEARSSGLETTDGVVDVSPTTLLDIGTGLRLSNPADGEASLSIGNEREMLQGTGTVNIPSGSPLAPPDAFIPFAYFSGSSFLDLSNPILPTFLEAGTYHVHADIAINEGINDGGACFMEFGVDSGGGDGAIIQDILYGYTRGSGFYNTQKFFTAGLTFAFLAGGFFEANIINDDNIAHNFDVRQFTYVQRIT